MSIICYTHDYENDTTYSFEPGAERSQITMTFTSEDPDYGTEELTAENYETVGKPSVRQAQFRLSDGRKSVH